MAGPKPQARCGEGQPADEPRRGRAAVRLPWALLACLAIAAGGVGAYWNSFQGVFLFDDLNSIAHNPHIRSLWPPWETRSSQPGDTASGRPVLRMSLAVNYAVSGLDTWSYHAGNLGIHILAGLALFGVVRRTLQGQRLAWRLGRASTALAAAAAAVWVVHPLQTGSVTYVVQRAESLMGLLYLLTLYCFIRGAGSRRRWAWNVACVAACALGMGAKEVMATAPVVVLLYDRTFLSGSFKRAAARRWGLYAGLFGTWAILLALLSTSPRGGSVTFASAVVTPWQYARTQFGAIVTYLGLSVWPVGLCLDYGWPIANGLGEILPPAILVGLLALGSAWALWRRAAAGFLGAWFFLILGPSSSFLPIVTEVVAEHRMYLPLAAVIALGAVGAYLGGAWLAVRLPRSAGAARLAGGLLAAGVVAGLGCLTAQRNNDYRDDFAMWADVVSKQPLNHRAHSNIAAALLARGEAEKAMAHCLRAIQIRPDAADAHNNLGLALTLLGRHKEAIAACRESLRIDPEFALAHNNLSAALLKDGQRTAATWHLRQAVRLQPTNTGFRNNLASALLGQGALDQAEAELAESLRLDPAQPEVHHRLAMIHLDRKDSPKAAEHLRQVLLLRPDSPEALNNLAWILATSDRQAVRDAPAAVEYAMRACELTGRREPSLLDTLAAAYAAAGRFEDAVAAAGEAAGLAESSGRVGLAAEIRSRIDLYGVRQPYIERSAGGSPR